jgi:murein L,D-transpeptidase YcbB/YkuD
VKGTDKKKRTESLQRIRREGLNCPRLDRYWLELDGSQEHQASDKAVRGLQAFQGKQADGIIQDASHSFLTVTIPSLYSADSRHHEFYN